MTEIARPVPPRGHRLRWLTLVWLEYARAVHAVRRGPLAESVGSARAGGPAVAGGPALDAQWLARLVNRRLKVGPWRPRCLLRALVLARLLRRHGVPAQVVIGLPSLARDKDAHAWVELGGTDIGPYPGRNGHVELVRYG